MAKLTTKRRKMMSPSDFAFPGKAPGPGSYPVNDRAHAANAKARVAQFGSPAEKKTVNAKANRVLYGSSKAPKGRTGGSKAKGKK